MSNRLRRSVVAAAAAGALCLVAALGGSASAAGSKGIKGDPQPELKPFKIGPSDGAGGTVAVASNGDLIVAYESTNGADADVCVLARAGHSCKYTHKFTPLSGDSAFGVPQVFAPSPDRVVVLLGAGFIHGNLLFTSTDGGKTFDSGVLVGDALTPSTAALIDNQIVYGDDDDSDGVRVSAVPLAAPAPPATVANPSSHRGTVGIGGYKKGVLVAGDNAGGSPTNVEYAASGSDFNATASYHDVGSFKGERFGGLSGNALLTIQTGGKGHLLVRLFNGTKFGSAHVVPGGGASGPEWWAIDQDPSGETHVIVSDDRTPKTYELIEYSTSTGSHWHKHLLGNAISDSFSAGLDRNGSGLVLGLEPAKGYPILAQQSVSFSLSKSTIKKGHKVTGKGKGSVAAKGRKIELQVEKSGRWDNIASTHEKASGAFSFSIKGKSIGTFHYRAQASDHAGYVEFGYSSSRTLEVKK